MNRTTRRNLVCVYSSAAVMAVLLVPTPTPVIAQAIPANRTAADPVQFVNPELRAVAPAAASAAASMRLDTLTPAQLVAFQHMAGAAAPQPLSQPSVVERRVPGPRGAPDVRVFIINARSGTRRPAILHTHGGGFILGTAAASVPVLQPIAQALDCVIVTVDYRLAPETPFPGSLEDNYAALKWLYANADELGADRSRIAVMGESAGGGHAAMLAIAARDRGEVPIMFQSLTYPMLDDRTGSTRTMPAHIGTIGWTPLLNRVGWRSLLGREPGGTTAPAGAVPARVDNLSGLPPAWIGVGSVDLFIDEDIEYARRLIAAGVLTELMVVPGAFHGFEAAVPNASISRQFRLAHINALARAFGVHQLASPPDLSLTNR
jgi:acetyl esterase/lipase